MHDGAGQRAIGARPGRQMHVRPLRRAGAVGIDHDQLGAAFLAGLGDPGHDIDLRRDGIAAPHDDQVRLRHLAGVGAALYAVSGHPAGIGQRDADGVRLTGIAHDVAQTLDPIPLHMAHGAGIVVGPDGFALHVHAPLSRTVRRRCPAPLRTKFHAICLRPWRRRAGAASAGVRDDGPARRSGTTFAQITPSV